MTLADDPRLAPFIEIMAAFIAEQVRRDLAQQPEPEDQRNPEPGEQDNHR